MRWKCQRHRRNVAKLLSKRLCTRQFARTLSADTVDRSVSEDGTVTVAGDVCNVRAIRLGDRSLETVHHARGSVAETWEGGDTGGGGGIGDGASCASRATCFGPGRC